MDNYRRQIIIKRIVVSVLVGLVIGAAISELSFIFLREDVRTPQVIELLIPPGTAERVARGETPPTIPDSMNFVIGDTLLVKNGDSVDHELGPLWIPAGTSASLSLSEAQSGAFVCSFQPSKYFGLNVSEALTPSTRLFGILSTGLPLGGLIALYSLIMPFKQVTVKKEEK